MYESISQFSERGEAGAEAPLASFAWPELAARLTARRDLRGALRSSKAVGRKGASFNPTAAAMLAGLEDKRDVNRDVLADGKQPWANEAEATDTAAAGD
jgi:hypothetical protein